VRKKIAAYRATVSRVFARLGEKQNRARHASNFSLRNLASKIQTIGHEERKILPTTALDGVYPEAHGFKETRSSRPRH